MSELWSGERVARWIRQSEGLDRQFEPVSAALFAAAGLRPGESVLDIGCGTGGTTRRAAAAVGPAGRVTGLDVSASMLEAAAASDGGASGSPASAIEWVEADVVTWVPDATFDVVLSRFGVMFFADPARAFANLAAAVRPGGRLCCAVWSRRDESDLFAVPLAAAARVLGSVELPPDDAGPFSLGDDGCVRALLGDAGWSSVGIKTHRLALPFAGGVPPDEAAVAALDYGPMRTVTEGVSSAERLRVVGAVAEAMAAHVDADGHVVLGASVRIVTAQVPA